MPSLRDAITEAQRMAWDESIGYTFGGDGNPDTNGYDCSAFVIRCLYRAGFAVPSSRVGTLYMGSYLIAAGFTEIQFSTGMTMQKGDIVCINDGSYGHCYFYMEDVYGYSEIADGYSCHDWKGDLPYAKIEASSSWGHPESGDNANQYGAHCEVWVHRLDPQYINNTHPDSTVKIYRWPGGFDGRTNIMMLKRIRDGQFNIDAWTNKFMDEGI